METVAGTPAKTATFTIGHSRHDLERFVQLLRDNRIEVVADVRSRPYSRFAPQFNKRACADALSAVGIRYLYLGQELGGRPEEPAFYDEAGQLQYDRVAASPGFNAAVERLEAEARRSRVALMCGEEDPARCHRWLLVGRRLVDDGFACRHIRGDGRVEEG